MAGMMRNKEIVPIRNGLIVVGGQGRQAGRQADWRYMGDAAALQLAKLCYNRGNTNGMDADASMKDMRICLDADGLVKESAIRRCELLYGGWNGLLTGLHKV